MQANTQQVNRTVQHREVCVPTFLYGTAWKEAKTESLVKSAIKAGFMGIDTANQRRHYYEAGVGKAVKAILTKTALNRNDLFLQSKFTYATSQDHRLPYDPQSDYSTQLRDSFFNSLEHLQTSYLDSYILHGPSTPYGLSDADWSVWQTMEDLKQSGTIKLIGVSNIDADQLKKLIDKARIKPAFVQNRCFARTRWDARIRELCRKNDILYQGFSLLTANVRDLNCPEMSQMAIRLGCSIIQLVFRFALQVGMIPLTGTTNREHMAEDLMVYHIKLSRKDMKTIENIGIRDAG